MKWHLLQSSAELERLISDNAGCEAVMLDTEFMRTNTFYPKIALVQLCFAGGNAAEDEAWLIDPLTLEDTGPLCDLLADKALLKVLHSPSEDLEVFRRWLGVLPSPMFDTQKAAALLDRGFGLGYRTLVNDICGEELPKGETRSDWLQRPLTQSQCEYAALDVTWLLLIFRKLHSECIAQDKLEWVLADAQDMIDAPVLDPEDAWKRVKSAGGLDQRSLAALQRLCQWRENRARDRDKPRNWILDDKSCIKLAKAQPTTTSELAAVEDVPPAVVRRQGEALLTMLQEVDELTVEQLPPPLPRPFDSSQRNKLKALKSRAKEIAVALAIAPEALLQSKDYELLMRESQGQLAAVPAHWHGWRAEPVIAPLRQYLRGDS